MMVREDEGGGEMCLRVAPSSDRPSSTLVCRAACLACAATGTAPQHVDLSSLLATHRTYEALPVPPAYAKLKRDMGNAFEWVFDNVEGMASESLSVRVCFSQGRGGGCSPTVSPVAIDDAQAVEGVSSQPCGPTLPATFVHAPRWQRC